jgi:hypothetical protein
MSTGSKPDERYDWSKPFSMPNGDPDYHNDGHANISDSLPYERSPVFSRTCFIVRNFPPATILDR